MEDLKQLIKVVGPTMIPFIKSVTIYFLLISFDQDGKVWSTIIKCAPIVCLMIFVLLYGMKLTKKYLYAQKIFLGLIFSCAGDALLNVNLFPHGMAAFGVAQAFYISAFGFQRLKLWIGIVLYILGISTIVFIYENIDSIVLSIGLPIYSILLLTMCWRAIARVDNYKNISNLTPILCAIGSLLFVVSDTLIAIDKFYTPISYKTFWIMTTYYAAQFGITLSIVNVTHTSNETKSVQTDNCHFSELDKADSSTVRQRKVVNEMLSS